MHSGIFSGGNLPTVRTYINDFVGRYLDNYLHKNPNAPRNVIFITRIVRIPSSYIADLTRHLSGNNLNTEH